MTRPGDDDRNPNIQSLRKSKNPLALILTFFFFLLIAAIVSYKVNASAFNITFEGTKTTISNNHYNASPLFDNSNPDQTSPIYVDASNGMRFYLFRNNESAVVANNYSIGTGGIDAPDFTRYVNPTANKVYYRGLQQETPYILFGEFPDKMFITNKTTMGFQCNEIQTFNANRHGDIMYIFMDEELNCLFNVVGSDQIGVIKDKLNTSSFICKNAPYITADNTCNAGDVRCHGGTNYSEYAVFGDGSDDTTIPSYCEDFYVEDIKYLSIIFFGTGTPLVLFDNIFLGNFTYGSNQLPEFNYSLPYQDCLNETRTSIDLTIYVNATDDENDTIYYAMQQENKKTDEQVIDYQKTDWWFGEVYDYGFMDRVIDFSGNDCQFNDTGFPDDTEDNVIVWDNQVNRWVLKLDSYCTGEKYFDYHLTKALDNLFYKTRILGFNGEDKFNISFYSIGLQNETTRLQFRKVGTKTEVYDAVGTLLLNETTGSDFILKMFEYPNGSNYISLWDTYDIALLNGTNYTRIINEEGIDISDVVISYADGWFYQDYFKYSGVAQAYNWTTSSSFNERVNFIGSQCFSISVTDAFHLNQSQNTLEKCFLVTSCEFFQGEGGVFPGTPVQVIKNMVSNAVISFLRATGTYETGKTVLWWVWVILFLGITISEYWIMRRIDLTFPFIAASALSFVIAWVCDYTTHIVTFLILLGFGLGVPVALHFLGEHRQ